MIIYLYGKDNYRRNEKVRAITEEYKKKHSIFTVQSFDLSDTDRMGAFKDALSARSLFDPFIFIIANNPFPALTLLNKEFTDLLKKSLEDREIIVLFSADEAPPSAYSFLIDKNTTNQEFPFLTGREAEVFAFLEAKKMNLNISPRLAADIAAVCGGDSWAVISELNKIKTFGLVKDSNEVRRLDLFQSILGLRRAANTRSALLVLERLLIHEDHAAIFNILASLVSPEEKKRFADYDVSIKSGLMEYELALTDYIIA